MGACPTICVKNLSLSYGSDYIFHHVSFHAFSGEIIGITGISGSGKSSLFHCLCGVIPNLIEGELGGEILINNESLCQLTLPEISTRVGIVFQNPETQLFLPTVEDEVAFGAENLCLPHHELMERIEKALATTGMSQHRMDSPSLLSGGQKQLVALAAVLSMEPCILLLDEVFAQVDAAGRERILPTISQLAAEGKTILMIDHNPDNLKICTRLLHLENGVLKECKA
ncbi:MAG: ABC transporter ATP-binding protein [Angelakisella sp.]